MPARPILLAAPINLAADHVAEPGTNISRVEAALERLAPWFDLGERANAAQSPERWPTRQRRRAMLAHQRGATGESDA